MLALLGKLELSLTSFVYCGYSTRGRGVSGGATSVVCTREAIRRDGRYGRRRRTFIAGSK